jgi:hypothetical protein
MEEHILGDNGGKPDKELLEAELLWYLLWVYCKVILNLFGQQQKIKVNILVFHSSGSESRLSRLLQYGLGLFGPHFQYNTSCQNTWGNGKIRQREATAKS